MTTQTRIDFYYWPTPNGWKVSILLEELGVDYTMIPVNIGQGDQFKPDFLKISPNNRMPAIVDHDPPAEYGKVHPAGRARPEGMPGMAVLAGGQSRPDGRPVEPFRELCPEPA